MPVRPSRPSPFAAVPDLEDTFRREEPDGEARSHRPQLGLRARPRAGLLRLAAALTRLRDPRREDNLGCWAAKPSTLERADD